MSASHKEDIKDSTQVEEVPRSILRYVLTDLVTGSYILAALAIDVFLIFQIYVWLPNIFSGILVISAIVILGFLEYRLYFVVKRKLTREMTNENLDY